MRKIVCFPKKIWALPILSVLFFSCLSDSSDIDLTELNGTWISHVVDENDNSEARSILVFNSDNTYSAKIESKLIIQAEYIPAYLEAGTWNAENSNELSLTKEACYLNNNESYYNNNGELESINCGSPTTYTCHWALESVPGMGTSKCTTPICII